MDGGVVTDYTETHIKKQIIAYLKIRHIFNYHLRQGLGYYPGLPDRVLHVLGRAIYIEVKTAKGKLSENQKKFRDQCLADGIDYWIIRSVEELDVKLSEFKCEK